MREALAAGGVRQGCGAAAGTAIATEATMTAAVVAARATIGRWWDDAGDEARTAWVGASPVASSWCLQ